MIIITTNETYSWSFVTQIFTTSVKMSVVYGDGQISICGGSCGGSDHCAWPELTWPEVTSVTWPEMNLSGSMFCACATGSCAIPALMGPFDRKWHGYRRSLDPFGVPLSVRNRKLCNIRSDRRSRDPLEVSMGCSLRRPRPMTIENPASYI
jgi:hypothetical protein